MRPEGLIEMEGTPLDEKSRRMIDALRSLGDGWHSRIDVATQIGKRRLNPVEMLALDMLASMEVIERDMRPMPGMPHLNHWVYRIKA